MADLLASFNDQSTSDYLVVYLRLLTSGYLQRESKFFEHFIEGGRTVKEFCQQEVEPMCKESDHIHIIALAQALSVSIQVEYMDRGEGGTTNPHVFPRAPSPRSTCSTGPDTTTSSTSRAAWPATLPARPSARR